MNNDLWHFIGLSDRETLISGILGWFLNPTGDHGLGNTFLIEIMKQVGIEKTFTNDTSVQVEQNSKGGRRFDILLTINDGEKIAIEVKCKTYGSVNQLKKYSEKVSKVIRVGFDEWNYPDLDNTEREKYPLLKFKEIATILKRVARDKNNYNDLISSISKHLINESDAFDHIYEYYISEKKASPPHNYYKKNKGQRFVNILFWSWFLEKMEDTDLDLKYNWKINSERSGVWCAGLNINVPENEVISLNSFNLKLNGPFNAWVHFEVNNKATLFGDEKEVAGKVQLRITDSNRLNLIHEEFKKSLAELNDRGYQIPKRRPGNSIYYNAITRYLSKRELRYSSLVQILRNDFKELILPRL